jgi:hypothetical protein
VMRRGLAPPRWRRTRLRLSYVWPSSPASSVIRTYFSAPGFKSRAAPWAAGQVEPGAQEKSRSCVGDSLQDPKSMGGGLFVGLGVNQANSLALRGTNIDVPVRDDRYRGYRQLGHLASNKVNDQRGLVCSGRDYQ